ncbi:cadmium-translocating P-type ATPase [Rhizobium sp. ARZ01]|uniref:cation-translocating P-type ATPase n=1 Tax=Rhizobium sp. ARZ01 TaxID=2769313 RepID=UPI00177EC440|nr:cation-translocating P-type ATPase [Rhizobium sp. ARZ01]MBD9372617.1 cadmium-translocating P-type ATPase [Rhizobium sp. ARZ01]
MSCCAPGTEGALEGAGAMPSAEELLLASRDLGDGLRQTDLSVPGVHCGACIATIEDALTALRGIESARVNLTAKRVSVRWHEGQDFDPKTIVTAIASRGYAAHLFTAPLAGDDELRNQLIRAVAVSGFAAMNIMLLSVSVWSGAEASTRDLFHWISALIAGPVLLYAGRFFFKSAWSALKHGHTNMDVPISLAVTLSYCVSLWETIHHGEHAWFDATVTLLFFLLIGRTLDHVMRDRARSAITGLARLSPRGAMAISADGAREYRPVEEIAVGDRLSVAAGERLAVDARVVSGTSDVDRSLVSGESVPVTARPGTQLEAGVINLTGALVVEATAVARESFLAEVIGLMEAAEGGRARYRRIADRAAAYYSPAVHLLALISFFGWGFYDGDWKHAMLVAVAVLIITCPCALGLAVPVVQVVAAGRLFSNGIMVKDGSAMERLAEIDTALFDKTGTLTMGAPRLVGRVGSVATAGEHRPTNQSFAIAAAIAGHSRHPLSGALAAAYSGPLPQIDAVTEIPGCGLEAVTPEGTYRLGNRGFACGGADSREDGSAMSEVVLTLDHRPLETYTFEDRLRPGARNAMDSLRKQHVEIGILSGDRTAAVERVASMLGAERWRAGLAPRDKTEAVAACASSGHKVLMVGDGINDAPALSAAHVSMAPATAADIGRQAADLVFLHDGLDAVTFALDTSRKAGRLIQQNFALAIGYNVIAVPVAILGHATPLIAAIAMSTSSIIVVANSLRLRGRSPETADNAARQTPSVGMVRPA